MAGTLRPDSLDAIVLAARRAPPREARDMRTRQAAPSHSTGADPRHMVEQSLPDHGQLAIRARHDSSGIGKAMRLPEAAIEPARRS